MARKKGFVVTARGSNRPLYIVLTTDKKHIKYRMANKFSNVTLENFDDTYDIYEVRII